VHARPKREAQPAPPPLDPELVRFVEALADVLATRDHRAALSERLQRAPPPRAEVGHARAAT
jgi:hypothetical protein